MRFIIVLALFIFLGCCPPVQCDCRCGRTDKDGHPLPPPPGNGQVQTTGQQGVPR